MKKHKKILILLLLIIITIVVLFIYNKLYYSKKEILSIINRSNETFTNIYIKLDHEILQDNEKRISELTTGQGADTFMISVICSGDLTKKDALIEIIE